MWISMILLLGQLQGLPNSAQLATGVVAGQLKWSNGLPAVKVRVGAMAIPDNAQSGKGETLPALFSQAESDENGRYRLEAVPPGRYYIVAGRVDLPTYYPGQTDPGNARVVSITSGSPIEGVDFVVSDTSAGRAGVSGTILIPTVPFQVRFMGEGGVRYPVRLPSGYLGLSGRAVPGSVMPAVPQVIVPSTSLLTGGVTALSGNPSGMSLSVSSIANVFSNVASWRRDGLTFLSLPHGEYQLAVENLPPEYEVKAILHEGRNLLAGSLKVQGASTSSPAEILVAVGLRNPAPEVAGRTIQVAIHDGISGVPWTAESVMLREPGRLRGATFYSDGAIEFSDVRTGVYVVEIWEGHPGNRSAQKDVLVEGSNQSIDIRYETPVSYVVVTGRVLGEEGNLPSSVRILATETGLTPIAVAPDGTFRASLQRGVYRLSVDAPGYSVRSIRSETADIVGERLRIEPERGPAIADVVITLSKNP